MGAAELWKIVKRLLWPSKGKRRHLLVRRDRRYPDGSSESLTVSYQSGTVSEIGPSPQEDEKIAEYYDETEEEENESLE